MHKELTDCCDAIEECYEFMLAYAGQGVPGEEGGGGQLRHYLEKAAEALSGISAAYKASVASLQPAELYEDFLAVLSQDAKASLAAIRLVQSQPRISSQLIDNLNASIHLRALLTDLFLIDEIIKMRKTSASTA